MYLDFLSTASRLQPAATTKTTQSSEGAASQPSPPAGILGSPILMIGLMFLIFYFLMLRPQQKRQKEQESLLNSLKRGDLVRTSGGIRGEIVDLTEREVTLLVAEKVKLNILRNSISGLDQSPDSKKVA